MSRYKMPFASEIENQKILQNRTSKFRLPFDKDVPAQQLRLTLDNISSKNVNLAADIKLPKIAISSDLSRHPHIRRHKNNFSIHEEINVSVKSDKQQMDHQDLPGSIPEGIFAPDSSEMKKVSKSRFNQDKHKFSIYSKKKKRFQTSASKYEDEEINGDYSQQSEDSPSKEYVPSGEKELVAGRESRLYNGIPQDSDEDIKIWETLRKDIQRYHEGKQKWEVGKHRSKLRTKLSKNLRKEVEDNQIQYISNQLKKVQKNKASKRSNSVIQKVSYNQDFLDKKNQPIPQLVPEKALIEGGLLEKISQLEEKKKKGSKVKIPLEYYISWYDQIKSINPFFRKLSQLEACTLLSLGRLLIYEAGKVIYSEGEPSKELYILIYGKALLTNKLKTIKKFALTGETLGQEALFQNPKTYAERLVGNIKVAIHREDAKTLARTCLLRVKFSKYYRIYEDLAKMGRKQHFNLIDNLFRINYINKKANLHHRERQKLHVDHVHRQSSLRHGPFFY